MMTKEELEKEAKQSYLDNTYEMQWGADGDFDYTRGYLAGAEPREKRIEELKAQIEKMKCCGNCCVGDKACYVRTQEQVNICPSWKLKEVEGCSN